MNLLRRPKLINVSVQRTCMNWLPNHHTHCTLLYLGPQRLDHILDKYKDMIDYINSFNNPNMWSRVHKPALFGLNHDVPVLHLVDSRLITQHHTLELGFRELFNVTYESNFPTYKPHVTVPNHSVKFTKTKEVQLGPAYLNLWED